MSFSRIMTRLFRALTTCSQLGAQAHQRRLVIPLMAHQSTALLPRLQRPMASLLSLMAMSMVMLRRLLVMRRRLMVILLLTMAILPVLTAMLPRPMVILPRLLDKLPRLTARQLTAMLIDSSTRFVSSWWPETFADHFYFCRYYGNISGDTPLAVAIGGIFDRYRGKSNLFPHTLRGVLSAT